MIKRKDLEHPIEVFNVDGTPNKQGTIIKHTQLDLRINSDNADSFWRGAVY